MFEPRKLLLARYSLLQKEQPMAGSDAAPALPATVTAFEMNIQPQSYLWKGGCLSLFF